MTEDRTNLQVAPFGAQPTPKQSSKRWKRMLSHSEEAKLKEALSKEDVANVAPGKLAAFSQVGWWVQAHNTGCHVIGQCAYSMAIAESCIKDLRAEIGVTKDEEVRSKLWDILQRFLGSYQHGIKGMASQSPPQAPDGMVPTVRSFPNAGIIPPLQQVTNVVVTKSKE